MGSQELIWLKFVKKLLNLQSEMPFKLKLEWKLWLKKVEKLRTLIQFLKLPENILNKLYQQLEDQLLIWIYKNSNNLEENSILASLTRAEEAVQTNQDHK